MKLDDEMKIWEECGNDEFSLKIKEIMDACQDYFVYEDDEYGIKFNPITYNHTYYIMGAFTREIAARKIENVLIEYNILGNDENIQKLVDELLSM